MQAGVQGILSLLGTGSFSGGLSGTPGLYLPPLPHLSFLLWNPTSLSLSLSPLPPNQKVSVEAGTLHDGDKLSELYGSAKISVSYLEAVGLKLRKC